jgi:hypothetical protein
LKPGHKLHGSSDRLSRRHLGGGRVVPSASGQPMVRARALTGVVMPNLINSRRPYTLGVRLTSPFLHHYRSVGESTERLERVLAVGRAFLTVSGFVAIYLDPTEPARLREVTYGVLLGYALYSVGVLAYVHHRSTRLTPRHGQVLHGLDILWTSALTFVSEGPVSPFFLFFLFVLLAAAYRWGFRGTVGTAVITVTVFLIEVAIAATGPWPGTWLASIGFELNGTILRVAYLLLTGFLLGYLAE